MHINNTLEPFDNSFRMAMPIQKAYERVEDGVTKYYVGGLASGKEVDRHGHRMATTAIDAFKKAIDTGLIDINGDWTPIPLRTGHGKEWHEVLGWIVKADIDDDYNLWIEAELDDTSSTARDLYTKLTKPNRQGKFLKLGLSVGGSVTKAAEEWDADTTQKVLTIQEVKLREVSVVGCPAYAPAYVSVLEKSIDPNLLTKETTMSRTDAEMKNEQESITEEVIEKSEESTKIETLEGQLDVLAKAMESLVAKVEELALAKSEAETPQQTALEVAVEKAAEPTVETPLEKTETSAVDVEALLTKAFDAVAVRIAGSEETLAKGFTALADRISAIETSVRELAEQPMDKSLAVRKSSESQEGETWETKLAKAVEIHGKEKGLDVALGLALNPNFRRS